LILDSNFQHPERVRRKKKKKKKLQDKFPTVCNMLLERKTVANVPMPSTGTKQINQA
jgi:hypothetical protein